MTLTQEERKKFNGKVPTDEELNALFDKKYPVSLTIPTPKLHPDQYALLRIVESDPSQEGAAESQQEDINHLVQSFTLNPITEKFLRTIVQEKNATIIN